MATATTKRKPKRKPLARSGTSFAWQISCYDGCEHGCVYCYGRQRPFNTIPYRTWTHAKPRVDTPGLLKRQLQGMRPATRDNIGDVFISSACDAYQPQELTHRVTEQVIQLLIQDDLPFTVLTKSSNVLRDIGLFKGYDRCRVGFTIITLDDGLRKVLEPNASPITDRCDALRKLRAAGVSTYCSVEPIMPDKRCDPIAIVDALRGSVDLFEFGKWNP